MRMIIRDGTIFICGFASNRETFLLWELSFIIFIRLAENCTSQMNLKTWRRKLEQRCSCRTGKSRYYPANTSYIKILIVLVGAGRLIVFVFSNHYCIPLKNEEWNNKPWLVFHRQSWALFCHFPHIMECSLHRLPPSLLRHWCTCIVSL